VEGERLAREALAIGRANGNADLELLAMTAVGNALVQQCRIAEGMALLDEAMAGAVGGECGDLLTVAHVSCMTVVVCSSHFDIERATSWVQAMDRFIERYGCPFVYAECRTHYGRVLFENGDWSAAETALRDAIVASKQIVPSAHALASAVLAELRIAQGQLEDAARVLDGLEGRGEVAGAVAMLCLARSETSLAAAVLRRRLDEVGTSRLDVVGLMALLGQVELASGKREAAIERARGLIQLGTTHDFPVVVAHGQQLLGLAFVETDSKVASAHFEVALAAFIEAELPYRAAQVRFALAASLRLTDVDVAAAEARSALSSFEDLGAGRDADAAAAFLRELGVKAARTGPKNIGRLTKREQVVLGLLGEGLSNPDIAKRLFISRKTVEHHVARILAKLGLRGRAEAAAFSARTAG
jgi:DNA-binding NarL/FixJ family response regulator